MPTLLDNDGLAGSVGQKEILKGITGPYATNRFIGNNKRRMASGSIMTISAAY